MIRLRAVFGDYPHTRALQQGDVSAPGLAFDFAEVKGRLPFRDFVRSYSFDVGELPLVPLLQARELGKPLVLVPAVLTARFQHSSFYVRAESSLTPQDLSGRQVAVRSDANTGVAWALGILADEYGVDIASLKLIDFEDNHIAEYVSPPRVQRAPSGTNLVQMLADGDVDAAITEANLSDDPRFRSLLPDPAGEARQWHAQHGVIPAGHVIALSTEVSRQHPTLAATIFELLRQSRDAAPAGPLPLPFGTEALRPTIEMMIDHALRQGLIKRRLAVGELYDEATAQLRS